MISSPSVNNGVVYVGSEDGIVYALNASNGAFVWKYTTGGQIMVSSPAVYDGRIYIGSNDDNVYSLNASERSFNLEVHYERLCGFFSCGCKRHSLCRFI